MVYADAASSGIGRLWITHHKLDLVVHDLR